MSPVRAPRAPILRRNLSQLLEVGSRRDRLEAGPRVLGDRPLDQRPRLVLRLIGEQCLGGGGGQNGDTAPQLDEELRLVLRTFYGDAHQFDMVQYGEV